MFGQKKYKHKYRQHLTSQESNFTSKTTDTILQTDKSILTFQILDNKGDAIPFANITIRNSVTDTTIHSDFDGFVSIKLSSGTFSITIFSLQFTPITLDNFIVKENTKTDIKTSLGLSNALRIALIYSIRKLTDEEIKKIVDDLSNDKEESELIKNKTCYIMWEI
ncbi:MAG: hypothetical protein K1X56_01410 [Flavobacteriales bacterium]|nr:hypothetical protein [Flavobacteriales bacterium]